MTPDQGERLARAVLWFVAGSALLLVALLPPWGGP